VSEDALLNAFFVAVLDFLLKPQGASAIPVEYVVLTKAPLIGIAVLGGTGITALD
jgi:hypothetical protein